MNACRPFSPSLLSFHRIPFATLRRKQRIVSPTQLQSPFDMCKEECYGNQYRGCGHYVRLYSTGNRTDCGSPDCYHSSAHKHKTARTCYCSRTIYDDRRVLNLFQEQCDGCKEASYDRGRRR